MDTVLKPVTGLKANIIVVEIAELLVIVDEL